MNDTASLIRVLACRLFTTKSSFKPLIHGLLSYVPTVAPFTKLININLRMDK